MKEKTNQQLLEEFLMELKYRDLSKTTIGMRKRDIQRFMQAFRQKSFFKNEVTSQDIKAFMLYFKEKEIWTSPHSFASLFSSIKVFYDFLIEAGYIDIREDPSYRLKRPRVFSRRRPRPLTREEAIKVLKAGEAPVFQGKPHRAALLLLLSSGLRVSELLSVKKNECFNLDEGWIWLPPKDTKGKYEGRYVTFSKDATQAVKEYLVWDDLPASEYLFHNKKGKRLSRMCLYQMIAEIIALAFPNPKEWQRQMGPHLLRRTFATFWVEAGGDKEALRKIMGWSDFHMIDTYVSVSKNFLRKEARGVYSKVRKSLRMKL